MVGSRLKNSVLRTVWVKRVEESGWGGVCPKYKYLCYTHKRYPGLTPGFVYRPYTDKMVWKGGGGGDK